MAQPYEGVFTALMTPFADDGSVDLDAYDRLAARQLDNGIAGLVACGTTAETPALDHDEWAQLIAHAVAVADGRAPVVAGVGTNNTRTTVQNIERAAAMGADAGLVVFPYYNKPNPDGIRAHVRAALEPGLPIMLYHVPGRTGSKLGGALLAEVTSYDNVIGLKEASGDMRLGGDILGGTNTPVLSGDDFSFLSLCALGARGVVSVVSNVAPAQTVDIWKRHEAGDVTGAAGALRRMWPLLDFLYCEVNPVPGKAAMEALGLCSRRMRLPLADYRGDVPTGALAELGLL